jgi:hypothetical protein
VRQGPNYSKHGKKAPSVPSFYDVIAVDCVSSDRRIDHFAEKVLLPEIPAGHKGLAIPPLIIVNCQIPHHGPSFTGIAGDGKGANAVYFMRLNEATVTALKADASTYSNALKLLIRFVNESRTDKAMRHNFKVICLVENMSELGMGSLSKLSGKPVLTRATGTTIIAPSGDYMEFDINVHNFSALARKSLQSAQGYVAQMEQQVGFVIQGTQDDELPEQMLGVARVHLTDFRKARPFGTPAEGEAAAAAATTAAAVEEDALPEVREKRGNSFTGIFVRKRNSSNAERIAKAAAAGTIAEGTASTGAVVSSNAGAVNLRIDADAPLDSPFEGACYSTKSTEEKPKEAPLKQVDDNDDSAQLKQRREEGTLPHPPGGILSMFLCGCLRPQRTSDVELMPTPPQSPRSSSITAQPAVSPGSGSGSGSAESPPVTPGPPLSLGEAHVEAPKTNPVARSKAKSVPPMKPHAKVHSAPPPVASSDAAAAAPAAAVVDEKSRSVIVNLRMIDGNGEEKSWQLELDESKDVRHIKDELAERTGSCIDDLELYMIDDPRMLDASGIAIPEMPSPVATNSPSAATNSPSATISQSATNSPSAVSPDATSSLMGDGTDASFGEATGEPEHFGGVNGDSPDSDVDESVGSQGSGKKKKRGWKMTSRIGSKLHKLKSPAMLSRGRNRASPKDDIIDECADVPEHVDESQVSDMESQISPMLRDSERIESLMHFVKEGVDGSDEPRELAIRLVAPVGK